MLNRRFSLIRRPLSTAGAHARTLQLLFIAVLLTVVLVTALPQPTQAELAVPSGDVSPYGLLNPDGTLDMSTGFQGTLDLRGWQVTLDGERGPVLEPASLSDASQAKTWNAFPNQGLNYGVFALAVSGSDLYVGGYFSQTGDGTLTDLGNIARYDTSDNTWHALPNQGLAHRVWTLAVDGSDLYVGGDFHQTGDGTLTNLGHIARYDTSANTWHALPNQGLTSGVRVLAVDGSDLYVGGLFSQTGDGTLPNLGHIARYDTSANTWHALPKWGLDDSVFALAVDGSDLYVGGSFIQTGDWTLTDLGKIARYDTSANTWHALPNQGLNWGVFALAVDGSDLYVGGYFTQTGDGTVTNLGRIARYDTSANTWHALPNQGLSGDEGAVWTLAVDVSDLYVGGLFSQTGDGTLTGLDYIARYGTPAESETYVYLPLVVR